MSRYLNLTNGGRPRHDKVADPAADVVLLSGPRPAVVHLPDIGSWYPAVLVEGERFIGQDAFPTSEDAMAVAVARVRARIEGNGDG